MRNASFTSRLARGLSCMSLVCGILTLLRPRGVRLSVALWPSKLLANTWAPLLALAGGVGALLGLAQGNAWVAAAGLCGAALEARHVVRVAASCRRLDRALPAYAPAPPASSDQAVHPHAARRGMLRHHYTPLQPRPPRVPWQRDMVCGTHHETGDPILADVWQPPPGVPRSRLGVIYVYGGGWHYLDKDMGTRRLFRHLAGQGHVVLDLAYTLAPKAQLPAMVADVMRAVAWFKTHAETYAIDPGRVVLLGTSSGAHLALLAAYAFQHPAFRPPDLHTDTSVRAVVSLSGTVDLQAVYPRFCNPYGRFLSGRTPWERRTVATITAALRRTRALPPGGTLVDVGDWLPSLLGGTPEQVPERYRLGSPIHHVGPHCPPTLLIQGAHDFTGIRLDVLRMQRALRAAGVPALYVELPDTEHGFDATPLNVPLWSPALQAAVYHVERFLGMVT